MRTAKFLVETMNKLLQLARQTREHELTRQEIAQSLELLADQCMAKSAELDRRQDEMSSR